MILRVRKNCIYYHEDMRLVIQRVIEASVNVDGVTVGAVEKGLMILVGVAEGDSVEDAHWLAAKTLSMRIFSDANGIMNLSILDVGGDILAISQFTLNASTRKGNRPSYIKAARPEIAEPLYQQFCQLLSDGLGKEIQKGIFGADMKVSLVNDGPVTIIIDSKLRE